MQCSAVQDTLYAPTWMSHQQYHAVLFKIFRCYLILLLFRESLLVRRLYWNTGMRYWRNECLVCCELRLLLIQAPVAFCRVAGCHRRYAIKASRVVYLCVWRASRCFEYAAVYRIAIAGYDHKELSHRAVQDISLSSNPFAL